MGTIRWGRRNTRSRRDLVSSVIVISASIAVLTVPPASSVAETHTPLTSWGYIEMPDRTLLRYTLIRPPGPGPFPTVLNYQGYNAGTQPGQAVWPTAATDLPARGYALVGVSVRGTGCSGGDFRIFDPVQARDGAAVVEWIATQQWSTGRVGMAGESYGGIMQLMVAAEQPAHLKAIAPGHVAVDLYRDVGMPGGIPNLMSLVVQSASFEQNRFGPADATTQAAVGEDAGAEIDETCMQHQAQRRSHYSALQLGVEHQYWDDAWRAVSPSERLSQIRIPVLNVRSWQDEQLMARVGHMDDHLARARTWTFAMNGHHVMYFLAPFLRDNMLRFFDRYLKMDDNGWESTPRLQLLHEVSDGRNPTPSWTTTFQSQPRTDQRVFYTSPGGVLVDSPGAPASNQYAYPSPSPSAQFVPVEVVGPVQLAPDPGIAWQTGPTPGGSATFETAHLTADLEVIGSASADLWISSTASDTDVQVTVTEVRPDGSEMYVQRGWLRLSHRRLDTDRSTASRPYHTHLEADAEPLEPGRPELARVEILPFNHLFRAGSRLKVTIDAPTGYTGLYSFDFIKTPAINTIHHGGPQATRFVFETLPRPSGTSPPPPCGSLINQPCRLVELG